MKRGMTLVELLVTVAFMSVLTLLIYYIYQNNEINYVKSSEKLEIHNISRVMLREFEKGILTARTASTDFLSSPLNNISFGIYDKPLLYIEPLKTTNSPYILFLRRTLNKSDLIKKYVSKTMNGSEVYLSEIVGNDEFIITEKVRNIEIKQIGKILLLRITLIMGENDQVSETILHLRNMEGVL